MAEYVVGLQPEADADEVADAVKQAGASSVVLPRGGPSGVLKAELPDDLDADEAVQRLSSVKGVNYAERTVIRQAFDDDLL